jgi:hypothetical protein
MFDVPGSFDEVCNRPFELQWMKWREAMLKEFAEMGASKVWKKIK